MGDYFNKDLLFVQDPIRAERWKTGMKGKLFATADILTTQNPGKEIVALAIAGGPACDWERSQLTPVSVNPDSLRKRFPHLRLVVCGSVAQLQAFLQRGLPLDEAF